MSTGVTITLIICGTLVILSLIQNISAALGRKKVKRELDSFKKAFPNNMETPEKIDNKNDVKFGGF